MIKFPQNSPEDYALEAELDGNSNGRTSGIELRGRIFTINELNIIKQTVTNSYKKGRTYISKEICRKLDWKQPNGWLKDRACRDVLLQLKEAGIINLPPSLIKRKKRKRIENTNGKQHLEEYDLTTPITEFPTTIDLKFAKGGIEETIWNELVNQYHYLGHSITVGRCIKYLILANRRLLGAISFSSPAWKLKPRDGILKVMGITNSQDYTINNSRFLILPIVQVPNFASYILSVATKQVVEDWKEYYSITPLIVETFVQPSRFNGTCYKAANWVEIGLTKGYAKRGKSYRNSQEPKKIFLYGLDKRIRVALLHYYSGIVS